MHGIIQRLPKRERLSIPLAGRTLLSSTRQWGEPLLKAHQQLTDFLRGRVDAALCEAAYKANYSFLRYSEDYKINHRTIPSLCSAALILNWVIGRAAGAFSKNTSLAEAEEWFQGKGINPPTLTTKIPKGIQAHVLAPLKDLDYGSQFLDILPYAAEVLETSDEILIALGASRKAKRGAGIFYTPSDVSDYVVETLFSQRNYESRSTEDITWFDPACGTGCFLLSALYTVSYVESFIPGERALEYVRKCLFGVDVSPLALQSAAYILVLASMQDQLSEAISLQDNLFKIGRNLAVYDATNINCSQDLSALFPSLKAGADFVVSNPPYIRHSSSKALQSSLFLEANLEYKKGENIYPTFVRMIPSLSESQYGSGGMIVPLSVTYNTRQEFHQLRQFMWSSGEWRLAHFDRTPDSLFGDDVKTRNTIVFFARNREREPAIHTSELIRWSSRSRTDLFQKVRMSKVPTLFRTTIIPKVGDGLGQEMLYAIEHKHSRVLGQFITRIDQPDVESRSMLRNAGTAYNWLPFEIITGELLSTTSTAKSKYRYWSTKAKEDGPLVFALVQSRLAYWLWRVWGDGFHLTDQFIISLPLSPNSLSVEGQQALRALGAELWAEMLENKVVSFNAGISSISYCPYISDNILNKIDQTLIWEYDLPKLAVNYLKDFIRRTIVAGRDDEITMNPALRKWMTKEKKNEHYLSGD